MSNLTVYDNNGRAQVVDRPYDVIMIKKSYIEHEDLTWYQYSNARVRQAHHLTPNYQCLIAWQPRTEPQYANIAHKTPGGLSLSPNKTIIIEANPMHLYYYAWDYGNNFRKQNYGMEVYNEQGDITWASYHTSMHILDTIDVTDIRSVGGDLSNYFRKNYGHTNVAVIPVALPDYQSGRYFYTFRWCFDEVGALRVFLNPYLYLDNDEINMGIFHGNPVFRLHVIIVDLTNAQNFQNG